MSTETEVPTYLSPTLDRDVFRNVIGHFASGVTVITTRHEGVDYGMTASASPGANPNISIGNQCARSWTLPDGRLDHDLRSQDLRAALASPTLPVAHP